ncbi:MAG TPA: BMP family ABC transporter substrate-binding protein [Acidimicrobiales bacterium]|nr:BMP family ABC transporter substrate-binding protein [Acidimicrobiales bacterium]
MRRRWLKGLGMVLALSLLAAACGDDDDDDASTDETSDEGGEAASDFTAGQVTDTGGVDDRSFNQTAYAGLQEAAEEVGFEPQVLESESEADFAPNIQTLIEQDNDLIITVGFLLGDATAAAAEENPDQNFAIVDYDYSVDAGDSADEFDNVRELTFSTDQAAFLAGYVAAATTETGTVGTYGGINIPTVTIFMDGFSAGVDYWNEENDGDVELIGWDAEAQDGLFTGDFENQAAGRSTTEQLLDDGADIVMPVAGPVGLGSVEAVEASGSDAKLIWVDTDGCVTVEESCDLFLTSVMKNMDVAVRDTTEAAAEGDFEGGLYTGTLENEGVDIAPFHEFDESVPQEVKDAVDDLTQQIIDGDIETRPGG